MAVNGWLFFSVDVLSMKMIMNKIKVTKLKFYSAFLICLWLSPFTPSAPTPPHFEFFFFCFIVVFILFVGSCFRLR